MCAFPLTNISISYSPNTGLIQNIKTYKTNLFVRIRNIIIDLHRAYIWEIFSIMITQRMNILGSQRIVKLWMFLKRQMHQTFYIMILQYSGQSEGKYIMMQQQHNIQFHVPLWVILDKYLMLVLQLLGTSWLCYKNNCTT